MFGSPEYKKYLERKRQEHQQLFTQSAAGLPAITNRDSDIPNVYAAIRAVQMAQQNGEELDFAAPPVASFSILADANGVRDVGDSEPPPEESQESTSSPPPEPVQEIQDEEVAPSPEPPPESDGMPPEPEESSPVLQEEQSIQPYQAPVIEGDQEAEAPATESDAPLTDTASQSPDLTAEMPVVTSEDAGFLEEPVVGDDAQSVLDISSSAAPGDAEDLFSQTDVGVVESLDIPELGDAQSAVAMPLVELASQLPESILDHESPQPKSESPPASSREHSQPPRKRASDRRTTTQRMQAKAQSMRHGLLPRQERGEISAEELEAVGGEAAPPIPFLHGDRQAVAPDVDIQARLGDPGVNDADGGTTPDEIEPALDSLSIAAEQTATRLGLVLLEMAECIDDLNDRLSDVEGILRRSFGA